MDPGGEGRRAGQSGGGVRAHWSGGDFGGAASIQAEGRNTIPTSANPFDHSVGDEGQLGISVPSHTAPTTSEPQFIDQDARDEFNPGISIPTQASTTLRPHGDIGNEEVPSITLSKGSSNFQISETNATVILNGDGQFTKVQRNLICDCIANLPDINNNLREHVLTQSITTLPCAKAAFKDDQNKNKSVSCFKGTRTALLREMADCVTGSSESRMYVLSGLAGIGKSTVAYTIASRAANLNLLGASFFFSRDEANRNNARRFFTTIAYQLCVYSETFAKAIGDVLKTERGSAVTTKNPQRQLQALILDPLRSIARLSHFQPILIVVDALDECVKEDAFLVLTGLSQLIRDLPLFRVILTTRLLPYFDGFWDSQDGHKIFHLQDIGDKIVDGDIRLYLNHNLSMNQVQKRFPKREWRASDEEIDSLVRAAGRFFIIASTAVRYILDKRASNPAAQMQKLLRAFAQDHTFKDLDRFYSVILREVVLEDCDDNDIVSHYQSVVGIVIFVQHPLPVFTLAHLIGIDLKEICAMLDNLQSVISLGGDDVPHIYHKSFLEYITDQARCKDPHLRIDPRILHTQIAIRCFRIMCEHLKYNILGFGDLARFMDNKDGRSKDGITDEQLEEKIPQHLRYACIYWVNHLKAANTQDADLINGLAKFADEHMLYWFEVLSLIGQLDLAQHAIAVVLKLLKLSSDSHQLLSEALHFIGKFYEIIQRSALHTYYSALSFTPRDSLLYRRYNKEAVHNKCTIEGVPENWDAFITNLRHEGLGRGQVRFSPDSALLVSCSEEHADKYDGNYKQGKLKIWAAATGTHISTVTGDKFAVAKDFSTVASSQDNIATLYNMDGSPNGTIFTTSSKIQKLGLSSESSRVAAALSDGTVWLWDSRDAELIDSFDGFENYILSQLKFSPTGTRLAYSSENGIKLRDGISGRFIADLQCRTNCFEFSGDSSRIAALKHSVNSLALWNSESGGLIASAVVDVGQNNLAISANGSLLATGDSRTVMLWSENNGSLAKIKVLERGSRQFQALMAFFPDNILAIATYPGFKLYNVKTDSFIHTPPLSGYTTTLALSLDCTRLAVGDSDGNVNLGDIRGINASGPSLKGNATGVTALTLSRDCSRLACGFWDGKVELWGTSPTKRRIASHQHESSVRALGFGPDGGLFASGSDDGTIELWNGQDGLWRGTLKAPGGLRVVALSNSVLVAAGDGGVTLWSLDTLSLTHTFTKSNNGFYRTSTVSIAENNALIAVAHFRSVSLLDVENHRIITPFDHLDEIHTMSFLPDNLQLVAQSKSGVFLSFNLINKHVMKGPTLEHLIQPLNISLWHGVPIWHCRDEERHYLAGLFSQHKSPVPVLWIPRHIYVTAWTQGSSMIALGCWDGRIILLRLPTSHVG
ncbi:hypothetical protein M378DRAFT_16554 [Amanita muscaria Koide BX008]|uniref:NACHT domain-containing protein n=1 Tax=Amanita muscaria (strain Koide BX008) TaxID=946122 RepID=A0A0C2SSQ2_AMAMK|nr:hypothetical protein M378DRAFT_16554 [Amanita muscaria Koide BX008]